jgi:hypothetical protein
MGKNNSSLADYNSRAKEGEMFSVNASVDMFVTSERLFYHLPSSIGYRPPVALRRQYRRVVEIMERRQQFRFGGRRQYGERKRPEPSAI